MGAFVLYILEWSMSLLLLLLVWKLAFSGTTFHRLNRCYLLGATAVSALIPLLGQRIALSGTLSIPDIGMALTLQEVTVRDGMITEMPAVQNAESGSMWAWALVGAYALYVMVLAAGWGRSLVRTLRFLKGRKYRRIGRRVRLYLADGEFGPFSWMNCIVMPGGESGFVRRAELMHEMTHVRKYHCLDLVFLMFCTMLNPTCWLVMKEIRIIHEFEADEEVISRIGHEGRDYQRLLIIRTVGAEAYALASSFNSNIKQRIIMMKKEKTLKRRKLCLLAVIPVLAFTLAACGSAGKVQNRSPKAGSTISGTVTCDGEPVPMASLQEVDAEGRICRTAMTGPDGRYSFELAGREHSLQIAYVGYEPVLVPIDRKEINIALTEAPLTDADDMPEFPGGQDALLNYLMRTIRYPKECYENGIQGRVVVSFIVEKDGSVSEACVVKNVEPKLDAEALRVISLMPKWEPGKHDGKPVRVSYSVPINFRLE